MTNRCHTARERDTCADFLHAVIDILKPTQVLAIGGDAHKAVANMGIDSVQVRHPSYGGQNVFIRQIEEAYALPAETQPDLFTQPAA
jgi:uracil-DNA glycosylase